MSNSLEVIGGRLTARAVEILKLNSDMIECECPSKLLEILDMIRAFNSYTTECIIKYPADANTHKWLKTAAENLDSLLCNTVIQLARMEGFVDENNELTSRARIIP